MQPWKERMNGAVDKASCREDALVGKQQSLVPQYWCVVDDNSCGIFSIILIPIGARCAGISWCSSPHIISISYIPAHKYPHHRRHLEGDDGNQTGDCACNQYLVVVLVRHHWKPRKDLKMSSMTLLWTLTSSKTFRMCSSCAIASSQAQGQSQEGSDNLDRATRLRVVQHMLLALNSRSKPGNGRCRGADFLVCRSQHLYTARGQSFQTSLSWEAFAASQMEIKYHKWQVAQLAPEWVLLSYRASGAQRSEIVKLPATTWCLHKSCMQADALLPGAADSLLTFSILLI